MVCLIYCSDVLDMIHMKPEPATANDSCHMSRDIVWLSVGDEGDLSDNYDVHRSHHSYHTQAHVLADTWHLGSLQNNG